MLTSYSSEAVIYQKGKVVITPNRATCDKGTWRLSDISSVCIEEVERSGFSWNGGWQATGMFAVGFFVKCFSAIFKIKPLDWLGNFIVVIAMILYFFAVRSPEKIFIRIFLTIKGQRVMFCERNALKFDDDDNLLKAREECQEITEALGKAIGSRAS